MRSFVFGIVVFGFVGYGSAFGLTSDKTYTFNTSIELLELETTGLANTQAVLPISAITNTDHFKDTSYKDYHDYFQVESLWGSLMPHTRGMQELYRHTQGIQLHYQRSMLRNQYHPNLFRKPLYYGTTLNFQSLGSQAAGYAIGLGFSLFIPVNKSLKTRFTSGMGVGYLSRPYSLDNPTNIAIGSHFNGMMRLGFQRDLWNGKSNNGRQSMQLNAGLTHFSNGNWSQPNLGINIPYLSMSYRYQLGNVSSMKGVSLDHSQRIKQLNLEMDKNRTFRSFSRDWIWIGGMRIGRRQIEIDQEQNFAIGLFELLAERLYSWNELNNNKNLRSFSAHPHFGFTVFFDRTYQYTKPNPLPEYDFQKTTELAFLVGNRYVFGRVGVLTDIGVYVYKPASAKKSFFQALGLSYSVNPKWILTARLKVHSSVADYIEWGLGYRF